MSKHTSADRRQFAHRIAIEHGTLTGAVEADAIIVGPNVLVSF